MAATTLSPPVQVLDIAAVAIQKAVREFRMFLDHPINLSFACALSTAHFAVGGRASFKAVWAGLNPLSVAGPHILWSESARNSHPISPHCGLMEKRRYRSTAICKYRTRKWMGASARVQGLRERLGQERSDSVPDGFFGPCDPLPA
jgi:hypothetical protein